MEFESLLAHYDNQLRATLNAEYVDQSFLIGFISNLQSKVYEVIVVSLESTAAGLNALTTLLQLQKVWIQLHYKIISFYKAHHRALYAQVDAQMQQRRKNQANSPKFHPVEIRKLHDNYIKCHNLMYQFYLRIASHILATYRIDGLPPAVLRLQQSLQNPSVSVPDVARSSLVAVLYTCALNLGNLARTRSFIELTYLKPSLSIKNFYQSLKPRQSEQLVKEYYQKALEFYRMCILLAPNSNEPYSHIGMIYSSVGDRYLASYWFLRSQSTFETTFETGLKNLENTLAKDDFRKAMGSGASDTKDVFMCLLSHYYPAKWRKPQAIASQNRFQLELQLWDLMNAVEPDCLECEYRALVNSHIFVDQIVMLVCFRHLVDDGERKKFDTFVATYIEMTIKKMQLVLKSATTTRQKANCFIALRVCLAVLRGAKDVRANFAHYAVLQRLVNSLLVENPSFSDKSTRNYLFQEDIDLKGLQLEKRRGPWKEYQLYPLVDFHDKDLHNGRVGLYGSAEESMEHENKLRECAVLVLGRKLLELSREYTLTDNQFEKCKADKATPEPIKKLILKQKPKKEPTHKLSPVPVDLWRKPSSSPSSTVNLLREPEVELRAAGDVGAAGEVGEAEEAGKGGDAKSNQHHTPTPNSLEEIESFILKHSSQLHFATVPRPREEPLLAQMPAQTALPVQSAPTMSPVGGLHAGASSVAPIAAPLTPSVPMAAPHGGFPMPMWPYPQQYGPPQVYPAPPMPQYPYIPQPYFAQSQGNRQSGHGP